MTPDQRATSAREYLGYARQVTLADLPHTVLLRMAAELRRQLGQVLDVVTEFEAEAAARSVTASYRRPDGSAEFVAVDVLTVLGALESAVWWAESTSRPELVARYKRLARSLGDDR